MPCPFTPLLSLIPALPFIPWIIGKSLEKIGKGKSTLRNFDPLLTANINVEKEGDDCFSISYLETIFKELEYYQLGAPHFRKTKARQIVPIDNLQSQILLFNDRAPVELVSKLAKILLRFPLARVIFREQKLICRLSDGTQFSAVELSEMLANLNLELAGFAYKIN